MKATFLSFFLFFGMIIQAQDFTINSFDVTLSLQENGDIYVSETIAVEFHKKRRGIFRTIPTGYKISGNNHFIQMNGIDVPGDPFKVTNRSNETEIRIGQKDQWIEGEKTYQINYTIQDAFVSYGTHQELYWNVTGNEWPTKILKSSCTVNLPYVHHISEDDVAIYSGKTGSKSTDAQMTSMTEKGINVIQNKPLRSGEGLTIAVRLPENYLQGIPTFEEEEARKNENENPENPLNGLLGVGVIALMISYWKRMRERNYFKREIKEAYYAPEGLTSAHVGAYIDHQANSRDVISLIPYWATEGFINVVQKGDIMMLSKIKELPEDYPDYEHLFFKEVFKDGSVVAIDSFKDKFYKTLFKVKTELTREVKAQGYYDPEYRRIFKSWRWPILCLAVMITGVLVLVIKSAIWLGVPLIASSIIGVVFSFFTSPLTKKGYEIHKELKGLERFLKNPEPKELDRLIQNDLQYFERMLPYAVAFGLDQAWIQSFNDRLHTAPLWFFYDQHRHSPSFQNFADSFKPKEITSAFSSMPASSGSGGFSGGSSGGGFGGGGGGSW